MDCGKATQTERWMGDEMAPLMELQRALKKVSSMVLPTARLMERELG